MPTPHPHAEAKAFLEGAGAALLPGSTTKGTNVPAATIATFHIQYGWDGTPTDADNRENTVLRMTVWIPKGKGKEIEGADLAAALRAELLTWSSANTWRVDRGIGRLIGVDPATQLPFCTFTVGLVLRAVAPTPRVLPHPTPPSTKEPPEMATEPLFGNPTAKARVWSQFAVLFGGLTADVPDGNAAFTLNDPTHTPTPIADQWDPVGALADDTPFDDGTESISTATHSAAGFGVSAVTYSDQSEMISFNAKETTLTTLGILYDVSDLEETSGNISGTLAQRDPTKKYLVAFHRENADECERYITKNFATIESISRSFGNKESLRTVQLRVMPDPTSLSSDGRPQLWTYYLGEKA